MPKRHKDKIWRTVGLIGIVVVLWYLLNHFLVRPRVETWIAGKYPEAFAVQESLEAHYPNKRIGFSDITDKSDRRQRTLVISVSDSNFLESNQISETANLICGELGAHAQKYNEIVLQNTKERRLLFFFTRQRKSVSVNCSNE